jgi:glutamate synthase (NADPH/NADH) large chain/glutamate synthase (ferredoxin)
VVEGCGSNGCEYMTGGVAVILGRIGANFGAGMTGGMAYVYDLQGIARDYMNMESIVAVPVAHPHWEAQLKGLIARHEAETGSLRATQILSDWDRAKRSFVQICPKEMLALLPMPLTDEPQAVPAE